MGELLGAVKLKDKITITALMVVFAVLLAAGIGAVTQATVDPHIHSYVSHIERGEDGEFDFVSICVDDKCENPLNVQNILSGVYEKTLVAPTCCEKGVMQYSFTYLGVTYSVEESIPTVAHVYEGETVFENGSMSASASCTNEGCTAPDIVINDMSGVEPDSVVEATCHNPRIETYTITHNGESVKILSVTEVDVPHTLNGVYATELALPDGTYRYGLAGLVLNGASKLLCGESNEGHYVCEVCEESIPVTIVKEAHNYVYFENETVLPTDKTDGTAIVKCTNDECNDVIPITVPKLVEGENATLVEANHKEQYKRYNYSFINEEYGITIQKEIDVEWKEHNFQYVESAIVAPSETRRGTAYFACIYEGCEEKRKAINLPQIVIGENAVVIVEATEQNPAIVRYTYHAENESFSHTIELELAIGSSLNHEYSYEFKREDDGFVLIGTCNQPECQQPITYNRELDITYVDTSTCYSIGEHIWSCVFGGETYTYSEPATEMKAHNLTYMENETVRPTFDTLGSACIRCTNEGCTKKVSFILPKVVVGDNAVVISTDSGTGAKTVRYIFTEPAYNLEIEIDYVVDAHIHNYTYKLEPNKDKFDLVGTCSGWDCTQLVVREENVATTFVSTSTCTFVGESIWSHEKDGKIYTFTLPDFGFGRHIYSYDEADLVKPDFDTDGSLVIKCTNVECGKTVEFTLPKVVVGENAVVFSTDPQTGDKVVRYTFSSSSHRFEISIDYDVAAHVHDYTYEFGPGEVGFDLVATCYGWDCDALVVHEENVETVYVNTSTCTAIGEQIWSYEKDGRTHTFILPADELAGHIYSYAEEDMVKPGFNTDGSLVIRCTNPECDEVVELVLPKAIIGENTVLISTDEETGDRVINYTFAHSDYDFEMVLEYTVLAHVHNYEYELLPGKVGFDLVKSCNEWDCDNPEIREENVETVFVNTSTCMTIGNQIWSYEKDGQTYTFTIPSMEYGAHALTNDAEQMIKPNLDNDGYAVLVCTNEGCTHSVEVTLPKVILGENALSESFDPETGVRTFKYTYASNGCTFEFDFTVIDNHTHEYVTTLEPHNGKFDLISRCTNEFCDSELRDVAVNAILVEEYYSCTEPGYQIWEYEKDGEVYTCYIDLNLYFGHNMVYDIDAETTTKPDFENGGSIVVYCKSCDEVTRTVELPMADLEVNTVFLEETKYERVYRYTHVTEDEIVITLYLTILK